MAVKDPATATLQALDGTRAAGNGVLYPALGLNPSYSWRRSSLYHLARAAFGAGLVCEDDSADTTVRILAGRFALAGTVLVYAGGTADLAAYDDDVAYLWVYNVTGTATIGKGTDAAGWPSYPHIKLAEVTLASGAITAILDRRAEAALSKPQIRFSITCGGTWAVDGDGARTNGGGIVGDVTLTEQAAALCQVYDHGTTTYATLAGSSALTGWTSNYQLTADAANEEVNDAVYFGGAVPFCELALDIGTAGVYGGDAFAWEYWDGNSWEALAVKDRTDSTAGDGKRSFQRDGAISFVPPADWASTTVNSQAAYWIRCRVTAAQVTTTPLTNSVEHELVTPADGATAPVACVIDGVRLVDQTTGTLHTAADVKFVLFNFTQGLSSGELTAAQDKRQDSWTISGGLACAQGDVLGVLVTQEDGTDEVVNGVLELTARSV